jgi:hypothetical protein
LFHIAAAAGIFTPVGANTPQHTGKRQVFHYDLQGFLVPALLDHLNVALHIQAARARQTARRFVCLLDGISAGNGLSVLLESGLFGCQTFVIFARQIYRTDCGALTTAGAFIKIYIAGVFTNAGFKIPRLAFEF